MQRAEHAIGRAALGGKAPFAQLGDHEGMGVADAMGNAGLLESGGDGPDLAIGAGQLFGNGLGDLQPGRVDPVVIGDENAHPAASCCFVLLIKRFAGGVNPNNAGSA